MRPHDARDESLDALIRRQAEQYGDRTFMTFGDGASMSFAEFHRRVSGVRVRLQNSGIGPGDRVAVMLKNSLFYPVAWLGAVTSGAVAVPVNSRLKAFDARYLLEHSGASLLITDDATEEVAFAAADGVIADVLRARAGDPMAELAVDHEVPSPPLFGGTLANIQYTSGTTGFPKGCLLTHRYWQRMGATVTDYFPLGEGDVLLTSQPHSYIDPQWNVVAALRSGCHLVLLDGFHPSTFMRSVAEFGVTVFYCLGVMPTLLLKQPEAPWDREHKLERVFCSAIPTEQHAAIEERFGVPWYESFGMTESGFNVAVSKEEHDELVGTGALGRALPHNEAAVFDENDNESPSGETGELVLRGLGLMEGYYRDPESTADFFRNGWAHTGDLVTRDDAGVIYYKGRRKEMIRRGGENIAPAEIESALASHPDVFECAVAPVPDSDLGEEIKAYVVLKEGREASASDLRDFLGERIAAFKVPRYWEMRDVLPHTSSEKIAKHELEQGRDDFMLGTEDLRSG